MHFLNYVLQLFQKVIYNSIIPCLWGFGLFFFLFAFRVSFVCLWVCLRSQFLEDYLHSFYLGSDLSSSQSSYPVYSRLTSDDDQLCCTLEKSCKDPHILQQAKPADGCRLPGSGVLLS